jgi:hypothetical protein
LGEESKDNMTPVENKKATSPYGSLESDASNTGGHGAPDGKPNAYFSPSPTMASLAPTVPRGNGNGTTGGGKNSGKNLKDGSESMVQELLVETVFGNGDDTEDEEANDNASVPSLPERFFLGLNSCRVILSTGKLCCGCDSLTCTRPKHAVKRANEALRGKIGTYLPGTTSPTSKTDWMGQRDGIMASYESGEVTEARRVQVSTEFDQAAAVMLARREHDSAQRFLGRDIKPDNVAQSWMKVGKGGHVERDIAFEEQLRSIESLPPAPMYETDTGTEGESVGKQEKKKASRVPLSKKEAAKPWSETDEGQTDSSQGYRDLKAYPPLPKTQAQIDQDGQMIQLAHQLLAERKERLKLEREMFLLKEQAFATADSEKEEAQETKRSPPDSPAASQGHQSKPKGKLRKDQKKKGSIKKKQVLIKEQPSADEGESEASSDHNGIGRRLPTVHKTSPEMGYSRRSPNKATIEKTKRWYVFLRARKIGILADQWEERGVKYVHGYPNASCKSFKSYWEAKKYYREAWGELDSGGESEDSEATVEYQEEFEKPRGRDPRDKFNPRADPRTHYFPTENPRAAENSHGHQPVDVTTSQQGFEQGDQRAGNERPNLIPSTHLDQTLGGPPGRYPVHPEIPDVQGGQQDLSQVVNAKFAGADLSTARDEISGESMSSESAAYKLLVPPNVSAETGRSLINGALDVLSLPGKSKTGGAGVDSAADILQELATTMVEGLQGEAFRVEGRVRADPNFNSSGRNYLSKIKNVADLQDCQEDLHATREEVWDGFKSTLQTLLMGHEGWSAEMFNIYFQAGTLPEMLRRTEQGYRALLQAAERLCGNSVWTDEADIFMTYHANKLGTIRTISARTRLQLLWRNYTYLRNSWRNNFTSPSLQDKQARCVRDQLTALEARLTATAVGRAAQPRNTPTTPRRAEGPVKCGRCKSEKVHPEVGAIQCPFKNFRFTVSKNMGRTAEQLITAGRNKEEAITEAITKHRAEN